MFSCLLVCTAFYGDSFFCYQHKKYGSKYTAVGGTGDGAVGCAPGVNSGGLSVVVLQTGGIVPTADDCSASILLL